MRLDRETENHLQHITKITYIAAVTVLFVGGLLLWMLGEKAIAAAWVVGGSVGGFFGVLIATQSMMYAPHSLVGVYRTAAYSHGCLVAFFLGGPAAHNFDAGHLPVLALALAGPASASAVIGVFHRASNKIRRICPKTPPSTDLLGLRFFTAAYPVNTDNKTGIDYDNSH